MYRVNDKTIDSEIRVCLFYETQHIIQPLIIVIKVNALIQSIYCTILEKLRRHDS